MAPTQGELNSPMTAFDWVSLLWKLPYIVIGTIFTFTISCFPSHPRNLLNWRQKLAASATHMATLTLTHGQVYAFLNRKSTGLQIRLYCQFWRIPHREVSVPMPKATVGIAAGSTLVSPTLHFVSVPGAKSDGPTMFYCHGGVYLHAMVYRGHIPIGLHLAKSSQASKLVFLEYTLTPYSYYPGQLAQIVEATRYLIEQEGISPEDLIIGGDSAGGHLVCGLLAHIIEPAPAIPRLDLEKKQLRAVTLISPWLDMTESGPSAMSNERYDYLSRQLLTALGIMFQPNIGQVWSEPINAAGAKTLWGRAFPKTAAGKPIAKRIIITVGEQEVLFDSCIKFATELIGAEMVYMNGSMETVEKIKRSRTVLVVGPLEVHVQCALDFVLRYRSGATAVALGLFLESI